MIEKVSWKVPEIFRLVQKKGNVPDNEIYRTLNMGIGMAVIVRPAFATKATKILKGSMIIGSVIKGDQGVELI